MKSSSLSVVASLSLMLSACCTIEEGSAKANTANLETAHLAFIAKYTAPASPSALPADFEDEIGTHLKSYDRAIGGAWGCGEQQNIFKHEKNLFQSDAAYIRTHHSYSKKAGANQQKFLRGVYEGHAPAGATPAPLH